MSQNTVSNDISGKKTEAYILLAAIFITSICGLAYELIIGATGTYIAGDGVKQFAYTIGIFLSSMGLGSFISRLVNQGDELKIFVSAEISVGFFGGIAHPALYLLYSYTTYYQYFLYIFLVIIGMLTGLEIPLITRILSSDKQSLRINISNVLSLDYLGSLISAIMFPLVLLPYLGLWNTSLMYGFINLFLAGVLLVIYKKHTWAFKQFGYLLFSLAVLILLAVYGRCLVTMADANAYGESIIFKKQTRFQKIVLTRWKNDLRLYLNGNIQFSSFDEYRYHETLIHPLFSVIPRHERVLVLGGGDGLALREIFKYKDVKRVDLVDLDPAVINLAKTDVHLKKLNHDSFSDPRVHYHPVDAWLFAHNMKDYYDAIIVDLPDPSSDNLVKLYSLQFYSDLGKRLSKDGGLVIQSTSPYFNRRAFWCIYRTVKTTGLKAVPLHSHVPSFGEWGYVIATKFNIHPENIRLKVKTKFLTDRLIPSLFYFPKDIAEVKTDISTLDRPVILNYYLEDYAYYFK